MARNDARKPIQIVLMGRTFTLYIDPAEEALVKGAVNFVQGRYNLFAKQYPKSDKDELVTMLTLDVAIKYFQQRKAKDDTALTNKAQELVDRMEAALEAAN